MCWEAGPLVREAGEAGLTYLKSSINLTGLHLSADRSVDGDMLDGGVSYDPEEARDLVHANAINVSRTEIESMETLTLLSLLPLLFSRAAVEQGYTRASYKDFSQPGTGAGPPPPPSTLAAQDFSDFTMPTRICRNCGLSKNIDAFHPTRGTKLTANCDACRRQLQRTKLSSQRSTEAIRTIVALVNVAPDPAYHQRSFAIPVEEDDAEIRQLYRPFILSEPFTADDWVGKLELSTALQMVENDIISRKQNRLRILVLYGSMRSRSYSRLLAFEASRILFRLGCDVRVYNPAGLPQKDDEQHSHPKVQELRDLSTWSDGHVWISPEQHGNLTGIFKQQIDWIPLTSGPVRPTQSRTLAVAEVSGGSQSSNAVYSLRILGRWMRMFAIPNQSSVPKAYTQFTTEEEGSRMVPSSMRDRPVDCMEELVKYTIVMRPHFDLFSNRYSEREERRLKASQGPNEL
ncbi:hypothetical protein DL771_008481 [Monosporascus sp. 5C6A]|nr:hypothetical protein DL771_008481 [Monosporascus sp. 5C6A]